MPDYPFVVAVQYHPEAMDETHPSSKRLFASFVQACRERMQANTELPAKARVKARAAS
jgi:gamma-glutamyl-gamma-aminobutyrate hydrolase PuuD